MKYYPLIFLIVGLLVGIGGTALAMRTNTSSTTAKTSNSMVGMNHDMADSSAMSSMSMGEMKNELVGLTGDEFDKKFIAEMISHHQGAIDMATLAKAQANHQEVKNMAADIVSAQTSEIAKMQQWQQDWGY